MSEFLLITGSPERPAWPPLPASSDPETILLRMLACLRDLDRIEAHLSAAYLETAIRHLRASFDLDPESSGSD